MRDTRKPSAVSAGGIVRRRSPLESAIRDGQFGRWPRVPPPAGLVGVDLALLVDGDSETGDGRMRRGCVIGGKCYRVVAKSASGGPDRGIDE